MKKTYIQPSAKAIKVQLSKLIMTSVPVDPSTEAGTQLGNDLLWDGDFDQ